MKPVGYNRGRGIRIFDSLPALVQLMQEYYFGIKEDQILQKEVGPEAQKPKQGKDRQRKLSKSSFLPLFLVEEEDGEDAELHSPRPEQSPGSERWESQKSGGRSDKKQESKKRQYGNYARRMEKTYNFKPKHRPLVTQNHSIRARSQ